MRIQAWLSRFFMAILVVGVAGALSGVAADEIVLGSMCDRTGPANRWLFTFVPVCSTTLS